MPEQRHRSAATASPVDAAPCLTPLSGPGPLLPLPGGGDEGDDDSVIVSLNLDEDTLRFLERAAAIEGITTEALVIRALEAEMARPARQRMRQAAPPFDGSAWVEAPVDETVQGLDPNAGAVDGPGPEAG